MCGSKRNAYIVEDLIRRMNSTSHVHNLSDKEREIIGRALENYLDFLNGE
jgi:hypothetical protein